MFTVIAVLALTFIRLVVPLALMLVIGSLVQRRMYGRQVL